MRKRRILKLLHALSTAWFGLCAVFILVLALRQAGVRWWVIFSLSGHSMVISFVLISLYLFAVFRGISQGQGIDEEHPLTSERSYIIFYVTAPILGGLAALAGIYGESDPIRFLLGITYGTLGATFLVWILIDPAIGMIEMLLPASRRHRQERFAHTRAEKIKQQELQQQLLEELETREHQDYRQREAALAPLAHELFQAMSSFHVNSMKNQQQVVDIGLKAWQIGGLPAMRQLYEMTRKQQILQPLPTGAEFIPQWWDGIGRWQNKPLFEKQGI